MEDKQKFGTNITLPDFTHPFTIQTDKECMLLWAETNYDKGMWVNALTALMQSTDQELVNNYIMPAKTKRNKFVLELRECLKDGFGGESDMSKVKRSKTTGPPMTRNHR